MSGKQKFIFLKRKNVKFWLIFAEIFHDFGWFATRIRFMKRIWIQQAEMKRIRNTG